MRWKERYDMSIIDKKINREFNRDPQLIITELAAILYRDNLLNLEQASKMAGLSIKNFITELELRNIKIVESDKFQLVKKEVDGA